MSGLQEALPGDLARPGYAELQIPLTIEEADMVAKVLLQARRGSLGQVAYRPVLLSRTRTKIMRAAGLSECDPDVK